MVLAFAVAVPAIAGASENAEGLDAPEPGVRRARDPGESDGERESILAPTVVDEGWKGPRVFLGYGFYRLTDGHGAGQVHTGEFGGYAPLRRFRLGGYGELGLRRYALGSDDILLRAAVEVGYQHVPGFGPFVPYVAVEASVGAVIGKRFSTPQSEALRGLGLVVGAELRLVQTLYLGVSFGYIRMAVGDLAHDVWLVRLRFGL